MQGSIAKLLGWFSGLQAGLRFDPFNPYPQADANRIYKQLFCDDADIVNAAGEDGSFAILLADPPDRTALEALAADPSKESRLRVLAYNALLKMSVAPRKKELLGVIVETGMKRAPATLAAYRDGRVSYIDPSGKVVLWESEDPEVETKIERLFAAGEAVVAQTGPWDKKRLPCPPADVTRITLLVSDGLYFGHAPTKVLQTDPIGSPVLKAATQLLTVLTAKVAG